MNRKHVEFDDYLREQLQDPEFAEAYLNEAYKEPNKRMFLNALKLILEAQDKPVAEVAEETNLGRANVYRMLSPKGNPRWDSITSILDSMNIELNFCFRK